MPYKISPFGSNAHCVEFFDEPPPFPFRKIYNEIEASHIIAGAKSDLSGTNQKIIARHDPSRGHEAAVKELRRIIEANKVKRLEEVAR